MILGLDFSTKALHAALIPLEHDNGEPGIVFREHRIAPSRDPLSRYFQARVAMRELCRDVFVPTGKRTVSTSDGFPVSLVVVEQPMGRFAARQMWAMFGAIVASVPGVAGVVALQPMEWRRELGLPSRLPKEAAIDHAVDWCCFNDAPASVLPINEHKAEALLIALAGRQQNHRAWSEGAA